MDRMPVYVKVDEYKDALSILEIIMKKIKIAKATLNEINELRNQENSSLDEWNEEITAVERKLDLIHKGLYEPEFS